jgi:branched-chain amino acid transport system substrate-binding protein
MQQLAALLALVLLAAAPAYAADPIRIGVVGTLSGPNVDRGQQEQYAVELALAEINRAGGVLNRPVEAFYGDTASKIPQGIAALHRLLDEQHVPVVLGAGATPITHAIMPLMQSAQVPLIVDISAGQDFVDASGAGGNPYVFKTIPSDLDIARTETAWLTTQGAHKIAVVLDDLPFNHANADSFVKAASAAQIDVVANDTVATGTTDFAPLVASLEALHPDHVILLLGPSTAAFFHAYEQSGWKAALAGRIDLPTAIRSVSPAFVAGGGLANAASIAVFTPLYSKPAVRDFVTAYSAKYGLLPTQRSFFAYESTYLVVDAIRRAGSAKPADIEAALKTSTLPSRLGGTYKMDDHNHPHTPMQILGVRNGVVTVIATVDPH